MLCLQVLCRRHVYTARKQAQHYSRACVIAATRVQGTCTAAFALTCTTLFCHCHTGAHSWGVERSRSLQGLQRLGKALANGAGAQELALLREMLVSQCRSSLGVVVKEIRTVGVHTDMLPRGTKVRVMHR
jgi:hypothetical protein